MVNLIPPFLTQGTLFGVWTKTKCVNEMSSIYLIMVDAMLPQRMSLSNRRAKDHN
jgi:hypothetical protein